MEAAIILALCYITIAVGYVVVCGIIYLYEEANSTVKNLKRETKQWVWDLEWKWKLWRERMGLLVYDVINVCGHYEVYVNGNFICSGDTYGEAVREAKECFAKREMG